MNDIENMLDEWRKGVESSNNDDNTMNLCHEEWSPKWKRFQPPLWKIFRWAYNIKRTLYTGVYPIAVSTEGESINQNHNGTFTLEFQCNKFESPIIDEKSKELLEHYRRCRIMNKDIEWPIEIRSAIDVLFSHNEIIALWYEPADDKSGYKLIYRGEAWATPEEYLDLKMIKMFGCVPEHIHLADTLNILVSVDENTLTIGLIKKIHNSDGCSDSEQ